MLLKNLIVIALLFCPWLSLAQPGEHPPASLQIAVGPDHEKMIANNYRFYAASWYFLSEALAKKNITITPNSMPWARAKTKVMNGELDGLFLAANFDGRQLWAELTSPLGYDYFGYFTKRNQQPSQEVIGMVRLGKHDKIHQEISDKKTIEVASAQVGLNLLIQGKISKFVMSQGYGNYILNNQLKAKNNDIVFLQKNAEKRSLHLAISHKHKKKQLILQLINSAIAKGVAQGSYKRHMDRHQVLCHNQLNCQN